MQTKNAPVRVGLSILSVAILVPLVLGVNHLSGHAKLQIKSRTYQADGAPLPPLPPPKKPLVGQPALVADGAPLPPLPPPKKPGGSSVLVADGAPLPPLPPPKKPHQGVTGNVA